MNTISLAILIFLILHYFFRICLSYINVAHFKEKASYPEKKWANKINLAKLPETLKYVSINATVGNIQFTVNEIIIIAGLYSGIFSAFINYCIGIETPFVLRGVMFLLIIGFINYLAGIPFSIIHHFGVEKRFGFSTITLKTWVTDQVKTILLALVLGFVLISGFLILIEKTGVYWWLYAWIFFNAFQLLISFIFPVLLAPIFYRFQPLQDEKLNRKIMELAKKADFPVSGVFQIDASRRSTHSNAFFAGFGKTRRVALFDTLLTAHTHEEILAILAHEIGHWKKGHVVKGFVFSFLFSAAGLFAIALLLDKIWLYDAFGLTKQYMQYGIKGPVAAAGLILVGVLLSPVSFVLEPVSSWFSRRHEYQADAYSVELFDYPGAMENALLKLNEENKSNIFPHPLYVLFNYSHPTLFQRIDALERKRSAV